MKTWAVGSPVCASRQWSPRSFRAGGSYGSAISQCIPLTDRVHAGQGKWSSHHLKLINILKPYPGIRLWSVSRGQDFLLRRKKRTLRTTVCSSLNDREDPVVSTAWLEKNLKDVRILDIRGHTVSSLVEEGVEKSDYKSDYDEYLEGHIPGSVFFDWTRDGLEPQDLPPVQLTHDSEEFASLMEAKGVSTEKPVVVYDRGDGLLGPRLWWALVRHGHPLVRILDGGLKKWASEGRPIELYEPCTLKIYEDFTPSEVHPSLVTSWETLLDYVQKPKQDWLPSASEANRKGKVVIIDARDEAQYHGSIRRSKHAGRVPGALNIPRKKLLEAGGNFKSIESQRQVFLEAGVDPITHTTMIAYCNGGVASCMVLLAWHRVGGKGEWSNYDGSWNEWGNRDDLPLEA